jgi:cytochrome c oxidase cbb3-type subunit 3
VALLFLYSPATPTVAGGDSGEMTAVEQGAAVFGLHCANCHGDDGTGGYGPAIGPELLERFPDADAQLAFVREGTGTMPGFGGGELTDEELTAVVAYTREVLAGAEAPPPSIEAIDDEVAAAGAAIYADTCSGCHGDDGEGGFGPRLASGAVVERYPDVADQIAVVAAGRNAMPGYEGDLSADDIAAVVAYTRSLP